MGYGRNSPRCDMVARLKTGSKLQGSPKGLSIKAFESWMIARGYSPASADQYGRVLAKSMADPVEYMRKVGSHQIWLNARAAWRLVGIWTGDPAIWEAVRGIEGPRKPPRMVRKLPSMAEWIQIGRRAWQIPGPKGAIVWLVLYSGLRIGDVCTIRRTEIEEAIGRGTTSCRQKGRGGNRRREWTPGPLARLALQRLVPEAGYEYLWQLLARSRTGAQAVINRCIPAPYSAHAFRHATPTYLAQLGFDLPTIQSITGHESLSALERYIHGNIAVSPARTYNAQAKLAELLLKAESNTEQANTNTRPV